MKGPLVEGVDYYMEGDKLVFTAEYHAKRGYCCNSKCRHCPYKALSSDSHPDGRESGQTKPVVITGLPFKLPK